MNGAQHAVTTLFLTILLLRIYHGYLPNIAEILFVFGAFISSHTAKIWNIPSFSPDMDILIGNYLGVNIHRKWYFHSYILMIPVVWYANFLLTNTDNVELGSLLFGINFGWNAHIIEDWIWSRIKHNRKSIGNFQIDTSLIGMLVSLFGMGLVRPEYFYDYIIAYKVLYYTFYFGFIPSIIHFFTS
jgi:hypothetical protein